MTAAEIEARTLKYYPELVHFVSRQFELIRRRYENKKEWTKVCDKYKKNVCTFRSFIAFTQNKDEYSVCMNIIPGPFPRVLYSAVFAPIIRRQNNDILFVINQYDCKIRYAMTAHLMRRWKERSKERSTITNAHSWESWFNVFQNDNFDFEPLHYIERTGTIVFNVFHGMLLGEYDQKHGYFLFHTYISKDIYRPYEQKWVDDWNALIDYCFDHDKDYRPYQEWYEKTFPEEARKQINRVMNYKFNNQTKN